MSTSTHPSTNGNSASNANSNNNHDNSNSANNNDNPQAGQGRPLPKKEGDLFKALVKQYESKQYKKAIKAADTILRKFPNHGETLAMKGLTVYYSSSDRKEEAHQFVKLGLRNDMRSHVCWHVYGLLHRADRNYLEAIKAYKQALRIDHDNLQILRDLSLLQIQMRDLSGFVVTRNAILNLKPTAQTNWLSFAVAKHLQGNHEGALQVIDIYLGTLSEGSPELKRDYQPSELQMYKSYLLLQTNNPQAALDHLDKCRAVVMDRGAWLWHKTRCHMVLHQYDEAKATLWQLFQRGAIEDYRVHAAYQCATLQLTTDEIFAGMDTLATTRRLTPDQKMQLLTTYENDLKREFPRSPAVQRIPLTLLEGEALASQLGIYIRKLLVKGVPSLAIDLGSLVLQEDDNGRYSRVSDTFDFKNHPTYTLIRNLTQDYIDNLRAHNKFHPDDPEEQEPSTIFWALFLQAGLQELAGNYTDALALVDECLQHTPTAVDVYEVQARILQKSGDLKAAVEAIDKGRDLDQQDRYMNNQTTKFMLQANMPETALERIGLFTNNDANTSPDSTLFDMQCSWYELELADCLARQGKYGRSLKKYAAVMKHFEDIHEDQFDFHSYCIRKVTLRAYCDVLDWEDSLWGQPYYRRAAEGTIRLYKTIYDDPSILADLQEPDYSDMSAAEKKKAKAVARKKKKAAEKKAADGEEVEVEGKELLLKDALEECRKLSSILSKHAPKEMSTWMIQYDIAIRRGKVMMAVEALFKARAVDSQSSELLSRIADFGTKVEKFKADDFPAVVKEVIDSELPALLNNHESVAEYVSTAAKETATRGLPYRIAVAKALVLVKKASVTEAAKFLVDGGLDGRGVCVESCRDALDALKTFGASDAISEWIGMVKERFPLILSFE